MTTKLSDHFYVSEFTCRCGCYTPVQVRKRWPALVQVLEKIRAAVGKPITVTSGYRCPTHNRAVGGAKGSQHVVGAAVDFKVEGKTGAELASIVEALIASGEIPDGGLGLYHDRPAIVHYDLRGRRARWHS